MENSSMINKYVVVHTKELVSFRGFVDAIDPLSESVILSSINNGKLNTTFIIGSSISEMLIETPPSDCRQYVPPTVCLDTVNVVNRKSEVYKWLVRNLLPVEDVDGVLKVHGGHLVIHPPYRTQDCHSSNTIILGRVQHLLSNMPKCSLN